MEIVTFAEAFESIWSSGPKREMWLHPLNASRVSLNA